MASGSVIAETLSVNVALSPIGYLRPWPGDSLIQRRYGGGVGNRGRWADRFAMSEQRPYVAAMGMGAYMLGIVRKC